MLFLLVLGLFLIVSRRLPAASATSGQIRGHVSGPDGKIGCSNDPAHFGIDQQANAVRASDPGPD